jgi:Divergent InlB B-repeat domain
VCRRGNQLRSGDHIAVTGNVVKAVLAATALALLCAWLALPSPAVAQTQFTLSVTLAGGGTGSVNDTNYNILCPTKCSAAFDQGSQVVLVASPDTGSTFMGWSGAGCSGTQSCIVTMNAAQNVTATFAVTPPPVRYTLNVHVAGGGTGSVRDTTYHISCPSSCSDDYAQGAEVVLVASPDSGSTFVGWSGAGCSGTQSCIVTMNADQDVTATFLQPGHGTLTAPVPKTRRHRQIRAKVTMGWRWNARRTVLTRLSFFSLPPTAGILVTCQGKRCPFRTRQGTARRIKAFERSLAGSTFLAGDRLLLTISARGRRAERAQVTIRRERIPLAQLLS